jgi:hypothetical protein
MPIVGQPIDNTRNMAFLCNATQFAGALPHGRPHPNARSERGTLRNQPVGAALLSLPVVAFERED